MLSVQTIIAVMWHNLPLFCTVLNTASISTQWGKTGAAYLAGINTGRVVIVALLQEVCSADLRSFVWRRNGRCISDMGSAYFLPSVAAAFVVEPVLQVENQTSWCLFGALMMSLMSSFLNTAESLYQFPSGIKQPSWVCFCLYPFIVSIE